MATARFPAATVFAAADGWREATLSAEAERKAKLLDKVMAQTKRVGPFWARQTVPKFSSREEAWGAMTTIRGTFEDRLAAAWEIDRCEAVANVVAAADRILATARAAMDGDGYVELNDNEVARLGLGRERAA